MLENQWFLQTHGDPLGTVRDFITKIWQASNLDGMLVTMNGGNEPKAIPRYIKDISDITQINPFKPLMEINAARLIPDLLTSHPNSRVGALLRPCELRALIEISKHASVKFENLLTICVDCLGTLPADEYQWRLERASISIPRQNSIPAGAGDDLAHEALKFARQGGIIPYRYRPACQVCAPPAADAADINILVLGLPIRQQIMVSIPDRRIAEEIRLDDLVTGRPDAALSLQHERVLSRMAERHLHTMERLNAGLGALLPSNVDELIQQLEKCGECQNCLDACPICSIIRPRRSADGHYDRLGVMRWLVSCAGCGMCEASCPDHLPTSAIFGHIRQQLDTEWGYVPGHSTADPLPLI